MKPGALPAALFATALSTAAILAASLMPGRHNPADSNTETRCSGAPHCARDSVALRHGGERERRLR